MMDNGELYERCHQQAEYVLGNWGKTDAALKKILDEAKAEIFSTFGSRYYSGKYERFINGIADTEKLVMILEKLFGGV